MRETAKNPSYTPAAASTLTTARPNTLQLQKAAAQAKIITDFSSKVETARLIMVFTNKNHNQTIFGVNSARGIDITIMSGSKRYILLGG